MAGHLLATFDPVITLVEFSDYITWSYVSLRLLESFTAISYFCVLMNKEEKKLYCFKLQLREDVWLIHLQLSAENRADEKTQIPQSNHKTMLHARLHPRPVPTVQQNLHLRGRV